MEHCSVGSLLNLKFGPAGRDNAFKKIDIDDLPIGQVELLRIRLKIVTFSLMLLMCAQSTSYSLVITFQMHIVINVLIHSVCIEVW